MTPSLNREAGRLRRAFKQAAWCAFVATQVAVGYAACGGDAGDSSTTTEGGHRTGAKTSIKPVDTTTGAGGQGGSGGNGGGTGGKQDCTPQEFVSDASDDCGLFMHLPCGLPADIAPQPECYLPYLDCPNVCGTLAFNCHTINDSCQDGSVVNNPKRGVDLDCSICANGVGRAPEGFSPRGGRGSRASLGAYVALAAELEGASVHAFDRLASELGEAGAPPRLISEARRSARDERRHARRTIDVARALGGSPMRPRRGANAARALEAVALENAVEGCVRETFGALVATWQGEHAEDDAVARLSRGLAADETRHAALSWGVSRWCSPRLAPGARRRIALACRRAIDDLRTMPHPDHAVARAAGLPSPCEHQALVDALETTLWRDLVAGGRRGYARA